METELWPMSVDKIYSTISAVIVKIPFSQFLGKCQWGDVGVG